MFGRCLVLALVLLCGIGLPSFAENLEYSVTPTAVELRLALPEGAGFRVYHTASPVRVLVDLHYPLRLPALVSVGDQALQSIRSYAVNEDSVQTRVVMDFNYTVAQPQYRMEDGWLVIQVDKVFVNRSISPIESGIRYGHERRGIEAGPLIINFLQVDLNRTSVGFQLVLGQDMVRGRETVSSMVRRVDGAIAAVNGSFFAADGRPLGLLAVNGRLIGEPIYQRTALGIGPDGLVMERVAFHGHVVRADGKTMPVTGINRPRGENDLIVYTSEFGQTTGTNVFGVDIQVKEGVVLASQNGSVAIPAQGFVVSGHGRAADFLAALEPGDHLDVELHLDPHLLDQGCTEIIGGGPRLVKDGQVYISSQEERFQPDVAASRAPRTALGITRQGHLLIVTVNGRNQGISVGMTLPELAELMIELGAVQAMNLDGGGSTTMVVRNMVLNLPADGQERAVSNALVITSTSSF